MIGKLPAPRALVDCPLANTAFESVTVPDSDEGDADTVRVPWYWSAMSIDTDTCGLTA